MSRMIFTKSLSGRLPGFVALLLAVSLFMGCQGQPSRKPPIHLNPNMDTVERYDPQAESGFFEDGMTMRQPVPGTVARGQLHEDVVYYSGKTEDGQYVAHNPEPLTKELLLRGQERYNIYCSPCHSRVGDGQGIIMQYNYPIPPPSFHSENVINMADGYLFEVITQGVRNMPSYRYQIPVKDRWAIVAYLRALQRSQRASLLDIPEEHRQNLK